MGCVFMARVPLSRVALRTAVVLAGAPVVRAQAINLDLELAVPGVWAGVPGATYGAASGQAGIWNAMEINQITGPVNLQDLSGLPSSAQFRIVNPASLIGAGGISAFNTGDYARLMNDMFFMSAGVTTNCQFLGLTPGTYEVWTYAGHVGQAGAGRVTIGGVAQSVFGPAPVGGYALGVSHVVHTVATTGTIDISITHFLNTDQFGFQGFQIVPVPAPGAAIALLALVAPRRRRRSG